MTVVLIKDGHRAMVSKATIHRTRFPADGQLGLRFRTCTCRKPVMDGVPCNNLVVMVTSSSIEGLSRT